MYLVYFEFVPYLPGDENLVLSDKTVANTLQKPTTKLYPVYPNPVNDKMTIGFSLAKPEPVSLKLFDVDGRLVRELSKEQLFYPGPHSLEFKAEDLPAGVYLFRMDAGSFSETQRLVLMK